MKQIVSKFFLILATLFIAVACSLDSDENNDFNLTFIPVESVTMPTYVTPGESYPVTMYYKRPNDCYYVSQEPYYEINGNIRTVAVQAVLLEDGNCRDMQLAAPDVKTFDFQCPITAESSFTFRFYNGEDNYGNRQFLEVVVPVQQ